MSTNPAECKKDITSLPNELLLEIFNDLSLKTIAAPSTAITEDPTPAFTSAAECPLKDLSIVCKTWRKLLLPTLFSHCRFNLDDEKRWLVLSTALLRYLEGHLCTSEETILKDKIRSHIDAAPQVYKKEPRRIMDLQYILPSHPEWAHANDDFNVWIPCGRVALDSFLQFLEQNELQAKVESLVVYTSKDFDDFTDQNVFICKARREALELWRGIFSALDPKRLVVAAAPEVMAALTGSRLETNDMWVFRRSEGVFHVLEWQQKHEPSREFKPYLPKSPYPIALHNIRPWTSIAYNEGSYIHLYKRYEYHNFIPPKLLHHILRLLHNERSSASDTALESLSYRAVFPFYRHLFQILNDCTKLQQQPVTLLFQFVPGPQSRILDNIPNSGMMSFTDCWNEAERCYNNVALMAQDLKTGKIMLPDYSNKDMAGEMDKAFTRHIAQRGWQKTEDNSWVKPA